MILSDRIIHEIEAYGSELNAVDRLLSINQLDGYYQTFRDRFGPDVLRGLDGEALLLTMHAHGSKDSLVYWLEFKNDDEFPSLTFGGIGGGSALKFGIYRRQETGAWMTGPPQRQVELSVEQAVDRARIHRAQLLKGVDLLTDLPANGSDEHYRELQKAMDEIAPDVSKSSWGRKYFSLIYPDKLDDYHNPEWERYHLVRLLQTPPLGDGRYLSSGRFVAIARELGMPINHLTAILNRRNGTPRTYWRVGTTPGNSGESYWPPMRDGGFVSVGWDDLGDLGRPSFTQASKDSIKALMVEKYPGSGSQAAGRKGEEVFRFAAEIKQGDVVLAAQGSEVLGIGKIEGDYYYAEGADQTRHRRPVTWLSTQEWRLPTPEGLQTTVWRLKKDVANLIAVEEHLLAPIKRGAPKIDVRSVAKLTGVAGEIQAVLERKGQAILYGPPGTGKTYWAERAVRDLAAHSRFGLPFDALDEASRESLTEGSPAMRPCIRLCCFHPAYGYEDFLEAYRPHVEHRQMQFVERDGIFKKLCEDAASDPRPFYLIIDEINRGDIPRIFGELLTVIEKNKRGKPITLPLTGKALIVPPNVFIVGTMNTADRSIALLDAALRRRFGFIELMPDSSTLRSAVAGNVPLAKWLDALNSRVLEHVGKDARNLQVGHSYFLESELPIGEFKAFAQVILEDVVPLLEEYCYGDFEALEKILGSGLVDRGRQSVRRDLFEPGNEEALEQALLQPSPELSTAAETVSSDNVLLPETEDEGNGADDDL